MSMQSPNSKTLIRESHEWITMRWLNESDTTLPRVLLVGDSIVAGHAVSVHEQLKENYCVDCFATAKHVTDVEYMSDLEFMLKRKNYELIVFNNGLHGFGIDDELYAPALREVLLILKNRAPRLAWRTSTPMIKWPVENGKSEFQERTSRVLRRNADALAIANEMGLPVLDLYTPMGDRAELYCDGVHCSDAGRDLQVQLVSKFILQQFA